MYSSEEVHTDGLCKEAIAFRPGEGGVEGDDEGLHEKVSLVIHQEGGYEVDESSFNVVVGVRRQQGSGAC